MNFGPGQQLDEQTLAGTKKRMGGAFKPLEKLRSNQADHLPLAALFQRVDTGSRSPVGRERVVDRQDEERMLFRACRLNHVEEFAVRLTNGLPGNLRQFTVREKRLVPAFLFLAGPHVRAAPLND